MNYKNEDILIKIVDLYIKNGLPIGSNALIEEYHLDVSSATIRNIMAILEKEGYLQKAHVSSGRIPSAKGYMYFANHAESKQNEILEMRLKDIFAKRHNSIDTTINEALKAINDIIGLTLVTSIDISSEILKSIQFVSLNTHAATIILVTSSGRVSSKTIELNSDIEIEDIKIAIRLFKERLLDTPLSELQIKVLTLKPLLAKHIKNYEMLLQAFIGNIFDFKLHNKVFGKSNIIKHEDFNREHLLYILDLIENKSIWSTIESKIDEEETLKIDIRNDNISFVSKKISYNKTTKEISIIGANRMDYISAKNAITLLENLINLDKQQKTEK